MKQYYRLVLSEVSGYYKNEKVMKRCLEADISNRKTNTDNWMLSRVRMESRSMKEEEPCTKCRVLFLGQKRTNSGTYSCNESKGNQIYKKKM